MHLETVVLVLIEVLIVIGLSRLVGLGFRWIQQPLVIGEIVAGIMLGPSLFGLLAPDLAGTLFPAEAIPFLNVLSQVGLIFFMFLIGLELDPKYLKGQLDIAILTSHVSILVPFALGTVLSLLLYPLLSDASVSFTAFALFLGAAMSITAFPVLARIITEHNLQGTRLGTLALTCAAVDDVTAWCLLALAIAVTRTNSMAGALPTVLLSVLYVAFMVTLGRKLLQWFSFSYERIGRLSQFLLAGIYMCVLVSALITELIGIHLIFGAFLLGAVMPKQNAELTRELAVKTEDFVLTFLLPVFFAYSGLRTQIGLLNTPNLWLICAAVVGVAIIGKYFGTYIAARVGGIENREASALGWLMNTRGLTELIILNIGLSLNVISPLLFTMLVIMALVTTFMTAPLLEWTYPKKLIRLDRVEPAAGQVEPDYKVLVPIANPRTQKALVQLAAAIAFDRSKLIPGQSAAVYPLSLIALQEDYAFESLPAEVERQITARQTRVEELAQNLEPPEIRELIYPIVRISRDVGREVTQVAQTDQMDLIVLGWHRSAFMGNRLGGRVGQILSTAHVDVAVFVEKRDDLTATQVFDWQTLLVAYAGTIHDDLGIELALRLLGNQDSRQLKILRVVQQDQAPPEFSYELRAVLDQLPASMRERIQLPIIGAENTIQAVVEASTSVDLTIAGASREWGLERQTLGRRTDVLARQCESSLLITRKYSKVTSHIASVIGDPETSVSQPS